MRNILPLASAVVLGVVLAASSRGALAEDAPGIVVYNAQHASLTQAWADGFTRDTGIKVTLRKGSDMEFANQIVQEGAASPADVFVTENSPAMALVDSAGLFTPLPKDILDRVPEGFRPSDGHWVGVAARSTVFVYDTRKLDDDDLPASMLDLAQPAWQGRWAASPSGADFQAIVGALVELKGPEVATSWLKAMKTNAKPYKGNSTAMKAVNAGEVDGALIYHYYYFGDQAKTGENSGNIGLHYFRHQDPGAFVSVSGAGVLKSSKHQEQAEAFVRWMVGKGGQEILRDGDSFEYAIAIGADANPKLEPIAKLDPPKVDPAKLNNPQVTDLMTKAGLL
ncbi:MAG: iron ABC transporter substrate-binding protein [Geminicoccaceae bacterium]